MIDKENCFLLGRIRKTTGFSGEVLIDVKSDLPLVDVDFNFVHLEIDGVLIPFLIEESDFSNPKSIKVRFIDASTREKARKLVDCLVYIEKSQLPEHSESPLLKGVEGYRVVDKTAGMIGLVESILQNPSQDILVVMDGKKEILIPVVEEFILLVDPEKNILSVDLPEGLTEINN